MHVLCVQLNVLCHHDFTASDNLPVERKKYDCSALLCWVFYPRAKDGVPGDRERRSESSAERWAEGLGRIQFTQSLTLQCGWLIVSVAAGSMAFLIRRH